jgi:hypothetical protein
MTKIWKRMALNTKHRAAQITFTVNKVDEKGFINILQINTIFLPRAVYNQILRDKKIQNLIETHEKITIQDMYFAILKYAEDYRIELVDFKRVT